MATDTPTLTVYCRSWCPDCHRARVWLEANDIPYIQIDVDRDPVARERATAHNDGDLHTPTFEMGDDVCVDFRPEKLKELLGLE